MLYSLSVITSYGHATLFLSAFRALRWRARPHVEQLARPCDVGGAIAVGEQSIVADAVQALGQHVQSESAE
jgi:hypothetical protein